MPVLLDLIWAQIKDDIYISRAQFDESLKDFTITPMENKAGIYAAVIHKGPSFHFITLGPKWALSKEILRQFPGSLIEQFGYAETFTPIEDARQHRFNKRLGFIETRRDDRYIHYRIEGLKTCQQ